MTVPKRPPTLSAEDALTFPLDVDIDAIITPIVNRQQASPIIRQSNATELASAIPSRLPQHGEPLQDVLEELDHLLVPYTRRNTHPGFFGYVASPGVPTDPLGHAMVAALNQNVVGYPGAPAATTIERALIRWFIQLVGLPPASEGLLLSGGSVANLSAMGAALHTVFGDQVHSSGLAGVASKPVVLAAESVHFSVQRAAILLGIGREQVRTVPTDHNFCLRPEDLEAALRHETDNGARPVCVVASAGSTTTGSVDPLNAIADICERHGVWFHVDAAYGGAGLLAPELGPKFAGIERADSVCLDLHKWFYLAFDASVLLFRDESAAKQVFFEQSDYVQFPRQGSSEQFMFFHLGPELSRRFRALPAYLAIRHYGAERLGRNVLHNVHCARYLAEIVDHEQDLELVNNPQLSICCFRFAPPGLRGDTALIDDLNAKIRSQLEQQGDFYLSATNIEGRPVLRVCIINHATRADHMEALAQSVLRIGGSLAGMTKGRHGRLDVTG